MTAANAATPVSDADGLRTDPIDWIVCRCGLVRGSVSRP